MEGAAGAGANRSYSALWLCARRIPPRDAGADGARRGDPPAPRPESGGEMAAQGPRAAPHQRRCQVHRRRQSYHFAEGEAVEVNNMGLHAVENRGSTDRIHLIFEYYDLDQPDPEWLAG